MWKVVLIHNEYNVIEDVITSLGYDMDINSYNVYDDSLKFALVSKGHVYYVILGCLDDEEFDAVKMSIKGQIGFILKKVRYTLEDGTPLDSYLKTIIKNI